MMAEPTLADRVARLEDVQRITELKHRYLLACDAKDADGYRACFVDENWDLNYGTLGRFETIDDLLAVFQRIALERIPQGYNVLDMHHAMHPEVTLVSRHEATGLWSMRFRQVNLRERVERVLCGVYDDRYLKIDGAWKIQKHHYRVNWVLTRPLSTGDVVTQPGFNR